MTRSFTIRSARDGTRLELEGDIVPDRSGFETCEFSARLCGPPVDAVVNVEYGYTREWTIFFRKLADDWRGWTGIRECKSGMDHLQIGCTADKAGHITMRVTLRGGDVYGDDYWLAEVNLHVEAGQLEGIAEDAARFFGKIWGKPGAYR